MAKSYGINLTLCASRRPTESEKFLIPQILYISKFNKERKWIKISFNWWTREVELIFSFNRKTLESEELCEFLNSLESISAGTGY